MSILPTKPQMQRRLDEAQFQHVCKIVPESRGFHILITEAELPLFQQKVQSRSNLMWRVKKTTLFHQASNSNLLELRL